MVIDAISNGIVLDHIRAGLSMELYRILKDLHTDVDFDAEEGLIGDGVLDSLDIGEDKLPNALPFTRILPADYFQCWNVAGFVPKLRELSAARLVNDARYIKHIENVAGMKAISDRTEVPLEREARKAMMRTDRNLRELDESDDDEAKEEKVVASRRKRNEKPDDDIVLDESLRILSDLVRLTGDERLPKPKGWWE